MPPSQGGNQLFHPQGRVWGTPGTMTSDYGNFGNLLGTCPESSTGSAMVLDRASRIASGSEGTSELGWFIQEKMGRTCLNNMDKTMENSTISVWEKICYLSEIVISPKKTWDRKEDGISKTVRNIQGDLWCRYYNHRAKNKGTDSTGFSCTIPARGTGSKAWKHDIPF